MEETRSIKIFGQDFRRLDLVKNPVCAVMRWLYNHQRLNYTWEYTIDANGMGVSIRGISTWQLSELVEAVKDCWQQAGYSWDVLTLHTGCVGCKATLTVRSLPTDNKLEIKYKEL
jgi:hypothetical protein